MRKVLLLRTINAGTPSEKPAGWCVECSDETAARLVSQGDAQYQPADAPLKKGNLEFYNNCTPLSHERIAAMLRNTANSAKENQGKKQTNTNTTK